MIKKKILSMAMATIICTGAICSVNTVKASAGIAGDVVGIVSDVLETFLPDIHQAALRDLANGGEDVEFLYFIPPKFESGKFHISAYNFFDRKGEGEIYTVKVYPKNNPTNPQTYNLKSGEMLSVDTSVDTGEYIFEFYNPGSETPFGNYYLSKDFKNKDYGIALAQNNNIYYLQKETNGVINEDLLEEYTDYDQYALYYSTSESNRREFVENLRYSHPSLYQKAYRRSRAISKEAMSGSNLSEMNSVKNLLDTWKNNTSDYYYKSVIESIITAEFYSDANSNMGIRNIVANSDVSYKNQDIYGVDSDTIGVKPGGYLQYKVPVLKEGLYKINTNMEGEGNLIFSYNERETGHTFHVNLTNSFNKNSTVYAWLKPGINFLTINNTGQSDIKFKDMAMEHLASNKDYTTSKNNYVKISDLSKFQGAGENQAVYKDGYLELYDNSEVQFDVTAPSKGKYLVITESSSANGLGNYQMNLQNLTNGSKIAENIIPLSDATMEVTDSLNFRIVHQPITVGARTIELEEGQNKLKFDNSVGVLYMKSFKLIKINQ